MHIIPDLSVCVLLDERFAFLNLGTKGKGSLEMEVCKSAGHYRVASILIILLWLAYQDLYTAQTPRFGEISSLILSLVVTACMPALLKLTC